MAIVVPNGLGQNRAAPQPKRMTLGAVTKGRVAAPLRVLLYGVEGIGKAQPLDAKVLTGAGFVPMGEIKVGDTVTGSDGTPAKVTGVFPRGVLPVFRVTMTDGASTECCDEHLWFTRTVRECVSDKPGKARTLADIRKTMYAYDGEELRNHRVPTLVSGHRVISSVTPVGDKPCQCITVDAADHLYVTDDFIVTHNSSFGAAAPNAIFLGPEDGTANLDVSRFPQPENWSQVHEATNVLRHETHGYQSLVLDTIDWLEPLCWAEVCRVMNVKSIESLQFGKGYLAALDEWRGLIADLDALRREKRMNVIILGHALVKTFKNPEGDDYDRYTLKLHEKSAGLFREWVDELLFANYQTLVDKEKTKDRKGKGVGGTRRMYCARRPAFDAKSRHGLPDEMPLSWEEFALAVGRGEDVLVATIGAEIGTKLAVLRGLAPEIADKAALAVEKAGSDTSRLSTILNTINTRIAENTPDPEQRD